MKMMDLQIFVAFAICVPQHGHFDAPDAIGLDSGHAPRRTQQPTGVVPAVFTTQSDVQRGLRLMDKPGG